jgi:hypothetical protein
MHNNTNSLHFIKNIFYEMQMRNEYCAFQIVAPKTADAPSQCQPCGHYSFSFNTISTSLAAEP